MHDMQAQTNTFVVTLPSLLYIMLDDIPAYIPLSYLEIFVGEKRISVIL